VLQAMHRHVRVPATWQHGGGFAREGFENFYRSQISGGMRKRAGLARAMPLDPEIPFQ
jgi:ABC-type proline/glycine betaine transport system ATPase subunit